MINMPQKKIFQPTDKKFVDDLKKLVGVDDRKNRAKLEGEQEVGVTRDGVILKIDKAKIDSDGWNVLTDNKRVLQASYKPDGIRVLPKYTETDKSYIPTPDNNKCTILINDKTNNHQITSIDGLDAPLTVDTDGRLSLKTDSGEFSIGEDGITVKYGGAEVNATQDGASLKYSGAEVNVLKDRASIGYDDNKIEIKDDGTITFNGDDFETAIKNEVTKQIKEKI